MCSFDVFPWSVRLVVSQQAIYVYHLPDRAVVILLFFAVVVFQCLVARCLLAFALLSFDRAAPASAPPAMSKEKHPPILESTPLSDEEKQVRTAAATQQRRFASQSEARPEQQQQGSRRSSLCSCVAVFCLCVPPLAAVCVCVWLCCFSVWSCCARPIVSASRSTTFTTSPCSDSSEVSTHTHTAHTTHTHDETGGGTNAMTCAAPTNAQIPPAQQPPLSTRSKEESCRSDTLCIRAIADEGRATPAMTPSRPRCDRRFVSAMALFPPRCSLGPLCCCSLRWLHRLHE